MSYRLTKGDKIIASSCHSRRACPRMYLSGVFSGNPVLKYKKTGCPIETFGHDINAFSG